MANATWNRHAARLLKLTPTPGVVSEDLADAMAECSLHSLQSEETLCWEGSAGDSMWFLLGGSMSVQREEPGTGRLRELVRVGAPSLAGHMALIDGSKRSATCVAVDELEVGELSAAQVKSLLDERSPRSTAFRRLLITTLALQLTGANRRIAHLAAGGAVKDTAASTKDAEQEEFLRIAGMLEGWTGELDALDQVEWVPQVHRPDLKKRR